MFKSSTVSVTDSAAALGAASTISVRRMVRLTNVGSGTVYIGDEDVTTSNGTPIAQNGTYEGYFDPKDLYAVVATGTSDLRVLERFG